MLSFLNLVELPNYAKAPGRESSSIGTKSKEKPRMCRSDYPPGEPGASADGIVSSIAGVAGSPQAIILPSLINWDKFSQICQSEDYC
jgi:uncharacterized membrane protein